MQNQNESKTQNKEQKRYQPCGALWKKKTADGRGFLSGRFTMLDEFGVSKDYSVSVWPNRKKTDGDNQPDFNVDYDTQTIKNSPARKKSSETQSPSPTSSVAAQNKAEELLDNPFKEADDEKIL